VDDFGVPAQNVIVFATEAMRRAQNAAAMLDAIRAGAEGLKVQILAPAVETLFGSLGARSGFVDVKGLFLDLGGGSVQMSYMDTYARREAGEAYEIAAAKAGQSLPFGAARLIRVLEDAEADVKAAEVSKLQLGMREAFENLRRTFPSLAETVAKVRDDKHGGEGIDVYLCGGGFRGYGSMLMHNDPVQPYPIPSIGGYRVSGSFFGQTKKMAKFNKTYDDKIFGMSKRRRAQFPAIIAVVEALIESIPRIRSVTFCTGGNREGALMMMLPRDVRESDPLQCVADSIPLPISSHTNEKAVVQAVINTLNGAVPNTSSRTVLDTGLAALFVRQIWQNTGEDSAANASAALHEAINREPSCPGLSHFARALLGLMLCARWGVGLSPVDRQIFDSLAELVHAEDADAVFWAMHIGAVAGVLATAVPAWPRTVERLEKAVRFHSSVEVNGKKKQTVNLTVTISSEAAKGLDISDLEGSFKNGAKKWTDDWKSAKVIVRSL
jgi:retrograde regulation protein 2